VLFGQPSTISQPSGAVKSVDQGRLGFVQSNWTSAGATSASILCGSVHKTNVKENRGDSYAGERACHLMMMMMVVMVVVVIVIGIVMVMVIND